ncbi:hypothetical protein NOCA2140038 [metagenome]|uniref:PIN domain-containing protein n=1 Tax=metagenome TaxID=256318 RepID=A0A2P2BWU5_9ZZZZ
MPRRKRSYFDASIYVAAFMGPDDEEYFAQSQAAILSAEQGTTEGVLSGLVMAETVGAPKIRVAASGAAVDEWQARLDRVVTYFRASTFLYVEESRRAGERAMELAVQFGLKGSDALHVAMAELSQCDEFHSLDSKHLAIGDRLGSMRVVRPYGEAQGEFPLSEPSG